MARYLNILKVSRSPEEEEAAIQRYLAGEGFNLKKNEGGVKTWQKGNGWVSAPQFIATAVQPSAVKIEAWLKFAWLPGVYSGEMDLNGAMGFAIKAALKNRVVALEKQLEG